MFAKIQFFIFFQNTGTSLITAANFCQDGKLAVVGTYDGRCIFYDTEVRIFVVVVFFLNIIAIRA